MSMWHKIDDFTEDNNGDAFRTYASQVGVIGCMVTIIKDKGGISTAFVPGVTLEHHQDGYRLKSATGYGETPPPLDQV